jgi:hypothetical protein
MVRPAERIGPLGRAARLLAGGLSIWILVAFYIPPRLDVSHPPRVISVVPTALALASLWYVPLARRRDRFVAVAIIVALLLPLDRLGFGTWWAWPLGGFLLLAGSIIIALYAISFVIAGLMAYVGCEETAIPNLLGGSIRGSHAYQVHT